MERSRSNVCACSSTITLAGGPGVVTQSLFVIHAPIEIISLFGVVLTDLADNLTVAYLDVDDGVAPVDLTLAAGPALSLLPPMSIISRNANAAAQLRIADSSTPTILDQNPVDQHTLLVPSQQVPNTLRLHYTAAAGGASGSIRWVIRYISYGVGGVSAA
jgi:hypothetical protein